LTAIIREREADGMQACLKFKLCITAGRTAWKSACSPGEPRAAGRPPASRRCNHRGEHISVSLAFRQSNHEGELVELIQSARESADAIIVNPAAYSFTSIAIIDALKIFEGPIIELHISNIHGRDKQHRHSKISAAVRSVICGLGESVAAGLDGGKRRRAVNMRLPYAEEVQIRPIQDHQSCGHTFLPWCRGVQNTSSGTAIAGRYRGGARPMEFSAECHRLAPGRRRSW
jgi:3-dehydroquinate dehydratase